MTTIKFSLGFFPFKMRSYFPRQPKYWHHDTFISSFMKGKKLQASSTLSDCPKDTTLV